MGAKGVKQSDAVAAQNSIFPDETTRQWFCYAVFRRAFSFLVDLLVILAGAWKTGFAAMLVFTLAFALPRRYIGGYHAGSPLRCILLSLLQALICSHLAYPLLMRAPLFLPVAFALFAAAIMHRLAPILPRNLHAGEETAHLYHRKAMCIALAEIFAILLFSVWNCAALALCCSLGMACSALSLVIEKYKRKKEGAQNE